MTVLDTNVLSELIRSQPASAVVAWVAAQPRAALYTTSVNKAEIPHGIAALPDGRRRAALAAAAEAIFTDDFDLLVTNVTFDYSGLKAGQHTTREVRVVVTAGLSVAALGVVFNDIGTSPVYKCFNPEHGLPLDAEHVLGVLPMIFWALNIVVAVKYVLLILRADNRARAAFSPCWP